MRRAVRRGVLTGAVLAVVMVVLPPAAGASVDLTTNTTTFTGLPDIPLTNLAVTLNGGPQGR